MLDARNVWTGMGTVVQDIETFGDTGLKFRIAIDGAGREKGSDDYSGYFNAKYFVDTNTPNGKFVRAQVDAGNIKKGTTLAFVGRIVHERWEKDGNRNSSVSLYIESLTYTGRRSDPIESDGTTTESSPKEVGQVPEQF